MGVTQLRQDPITGIYVAIAEGRNGRPNERYVVAEQPALSNKDPNCFFCPGNEDQTPPENWAYRHGSFWWVRDVPNKFPVFARAPSPDLEGIVDGTVVNGMYRAKPGYGKHDVIIETPLHKEELDQRNEGQVRELLWFFKQMLEMYKGDDVRYALIFKNKGAEAGATITHPHTQLVISPVPMPILQTELEGALRYFLRENRKGMVEQCGYCDMIKQDVEVKDKYGIDSDKNRVVADQPLFVALTPYASKLPFEINILPKMHQAHYTSMGPEEATQLAKVIQETFSKLARTFPNVAYNFGLHTAPLNSGIKSYYHWHLEIVPKLIRMGGLDMFGLPTNPVSPETAARILNLNHQP